MNYRQQGAFRQVMRNRPCLRDHSPYGVPVRANKKIDRQSFVMPAKPA